MADRNLDPHAEARVAMIIWQNEYAYEQAGGSMDFWDSRTPSQKQQCVEIVDKILAGPRADGTTAAPNVIGWHVMNDSGWSDITDSQDIADQWIADGFIVTPLVTAPSPAVAPRPTP